MTPGPARRLRGDATRNAEKIVEAARSAYAELGSEVATEEIARRAGVGIRTLFRRFPTKRELARAALDRSVTEHIAPALDRAMAEPDSLRGLTMLLDAAITLASREYSLLTAAGADGALTPDLYLPLFEALATLLQRAQRDGTARADLHPDDLPRILGMMLSVLISTDPHTDAWRRYLALVMDGLAATGAPPLPGPAPSLDVQPRNGWSIPPRAPQPQPDT